MKLMIRITIFIIIVLLFFSKILYTVGVNSFRNKSRIRSKITSRAISFSKIKLNDNGDILDEISDLVDSNKKVVCSCREIASIDWKSRVCFTSCNDFCNESDDTLRVCKDRCEQNLCSTQLEKCDIIDRPGEEAC